MSLISGHVLLKWNQNIFKGDLSKAIQESCDENPGKDEIHRKQWAAKPFKPLMFPLEVTASAMEGKKNVDEKYFLLMSKDVLN